MNVTWKRPTKTQDNVTFSDDHLVRVSACGRFRIARERTADRGNEWTLTIDRVTRGERFATRGQAKDAAAHIAAKMQSERIARGKPD